jgi:hypothetical protein
MAADIGENVTQLDLATIDDSQSILFIGAHEDGRNIRLSVDVFAKIGEYAYGMVFATEQKEVESKGYIMLPEFSAYLARLPLSGVIKPGEIDIDLVTGSELGGDNKSLVTAEWRKLSIDAKALSVYKTK